MTLTSSGIGSGSSDTVVAWLNSCSRVSMRISPALRARLRRCPTEIAAEQFAGVEDQITAIGAVQRPWRQQVEIGDQRPQTGDALHPADERLMRRIVLIDISLTSVSTASK